MRVAATNDVVSARDADWDGDNPSRQLSLRGVSEAFTIYEIREREPAAAAA